MPWEGRCATQAKRKAAKKPCGAKKVRAPGQKWGRSESVALTPLPAELREVKAQRVFQDDEAPSGEEDDPQPTDRGRKRRRRAHKLARRQAETMGPVAHKAASQRAATAASPVQATAPVKAATFGLDLESSEDEGASGPHSIVPPQLPPSLDTGTDTGQAPPTPAVAAAPGGGCGTPQKSFAELLGLSTAVSPAPSPSAAKGSPQKNVSVEKGGASRLLALFDKL